jgi:phage terminase large subunit GpA-like protein
MDSVKLEENETIVLMCSAQVGKTEMIQNITGYFIHYEPSPILNIQPTLQMAETYSKDRLATMIRDTPVLRDLVDPAGSKKTGNTLLKKSFPAGHISLCGANSPASLASRPCRLILGDEIDRFPASSGTEGDPLSLAAKRATTFYNRKKVFVSTPTIRGASRIEKEFKKTDQRKYFVPCPDCGHFQTLDFKRLKWEKDQPETAALACEECGILIDHKHKKQMIENGEWRSTAEGLAGFVGFHLNELYSPWRQWKEVAADFLKAKDDPEQLKAFINTSLGETWEHQGESPDWKKLYDRREDFSHKPIPSDIDLIVAGVDVQKGRIEGEIVGYSANLESWSLEYFTIIGDTSQTSTFKELEKYLDKEYRNAENEIFRVSKMAVDSGYEAQTVYQWAKTQSISQVLVVKGMDSQQTILGPPKAIELKLKSGRRARRGVKVWGVGTNIAKRELYRFLKQEIPSDEDLKEKGYPRGFVHFPKSYSENYFKMLTAEVEDKKLIRGYARYFWVKVRDRNEALDIRVYARAASIAAGIERLQARNSRGGSNEPKVEPKRKQIRRKKSKFLS